MEIPKELLPPSKEKETPASLTDPIIRTSTQPNPQAIMAMSKISSQVNYQSKIGNPRAIYGPYGLGAVNPMMAPDAGRTVLGTESPLNDKALGVAAKEFVKRQATNLLVRAGLLVKGMSSVTPIGMGANILSTTSTLNAGEADWLRTHSPRPRKHEYNPLTGEYDPETRLDDGTFVRISEYDAYNEMQRISQQEIFEKQQRERNERWSSMKTEELNTKLQSSDDHIGRYFSRRAIK